MIADLPAPVRSKALSSGVAALRASALHKLFGVLRLDGALKHGGLPFRLDSLPLSLASLTRDAVAPESSIRGSAQCDVDRIPFFVV